MNRHLPLSRAIALVLLFLNAGTIAAQTASITEGCPPLAVTFSAPAGGGTFFWDFQNGGTSSLANPSTVFTEPGSYAVTLRDAPGGNLLGTVEVTVFPRPQLAITADADQGCRPLPVQFTNQSTIDPALTVLSTTWTFGDGNIGQGVAPTHTYGARGLFTVSLSVNIAQAGCSATAEFPGTVAVGGVDGLNLLTLPNPPFACEPPLTVSFFPAAATPGLTYDWEFGNGETATGPGARIVTYSEPGVFPVTLQATDSLGCTDTLQREVRLDQPVLDGALPDTLCRGDTLFYADLIVADSLSWTFPSTAVVGVNELDRDYVVFHEGGWRNIGLYVVNGPNACVIDTVLRVFVDEVIVSAEADPTRTCDSSLPITYTAVSPTANDFTWLLHDGTEAEGPVVSHTYTHRDTTTYGMNGVVPFIANLIATNPSGCQLTVQRVDSIQAPNALFMPDRSAGCAPLVVTFADSSASYAPIIAYHFDYGDGNTVTFTTDEDHTHTYAEPGNYWTQLWIENELGCRDTSYRRLIRVGEELDLEISLPTTDLCVGDTLPFTTAQPLPADLDGWQWLDSTATLVAIQNGCVSTFSLGPQDTWRGPDARIDYELSCEQPKRVEFQTIPYETTSLLWDFGDGFTSAEEDPVHVYAGTGDYWVILTAWREGGDCPPSVDSQLVCIRELEAAFSYPQRVCVGQPFTLNASASADVLASCHRGYLWSFQQNGRPIESEDPLLPRSFGSRGPERVQLVVRDVNGCTDTVAHTVQVYGMSPALAASDTLVCLPAELTFTDLTVADTSLLAWEWDFGDNTLASTPGSATHTYAQGFGTDTVVLRLTDQLGCRDSALLVLSPYQPFTQIRTQPNTTTLCVGDSLLFTAGQFTDGGSFLEFSWDFGGESATGQNVARVYPEAGAFPVSLSYTELGSGCGGEAGRLIEVQDYPAAAFASTADGDTLLCHPAQVMFTNQSSAPHNLSYYWNFGNNQFSAEANPTAVFGKGAATAELIARTSFGCADTVSRDYTFIGPEGTFAFEPEVICLGQTVTFSLLDTTDVSSFTWDFGDGAQLTGQSPAMHTYVEVPVAGPRPVTLLLQGAQADCQYSVTDTLLVEEVVAAFGIGEPTDTAFCASTYPLDNFSTGADGYAWTLPNGSSTATSPEVTFAPGSYDLTLVATSSQTGCADSLTRRLTFTNLPTVEAAGDTICRGDTVRLRLLSPDTAATYAWRPATPLLDPPTTPSPLALVEGSTDFVLSITDVVGCVGVDTLRVEVIQPPDWRDVDTLGCPGDPLVLPLPATDDLYTVSWSPIPPDTLGEESLDLTVTLSDVRGCFAESYRYQVTSLSDRLAVPNIFTPNGDGINDWFRVFSAPDLVDRGLLDISTFRVYNRWGRMVYESSGPEAAWDGTYNGQAAPADVYLYAIRVVLLKSERKVELRGSMTLLR